MNIRSIYRRLPERFRLILSSFIHLDHSPKLLFDFIEKKSAYYNYNLIPLGPVLFEPPQPDPLVVKMIQVYQDTGGKVLLKVVKRENCNKTNDEIEKYLLSLYTPKLWDNCEISFVFVSDIPLTSRGKRKYIILQKLDINAFMQKGCKK